MVRSVWTVWIREIQGGDGNEGVGVVLAVTVAVVVAAVVVEGDKNKTLAGSSVCGNNVAESSIKFVIISPTTSHHNIPGLNNIGFAATAVVVVAPVVPPPPPTTIPPACCFANPKISVSLNGAAFPALTSAR